MLPIVLLLDNISRLRSCLRKRHSHPCRAAAVAADDLDARRLSLDSMAWQRGAKDVRESSKANGQTAAGV